MAFAVYPICRVHLFAQLEETVSDTQKDRANRLFALLVKKGSLAIQVSCQEITTRLTVLAGIATRHEMKLGGVKVFNVNGAQVHIFVFQHAIFAVAGGVMHYCWI